MAVMRDNYCTASVQVLHHFCLIQVTLTRHPYRVHTSLAGDVMLHETYTSCIRPDGIYAGKTIKPGDVIELQRGGTGMYQT